MALQLLHQRQQGQLPHLVLEGTSGSWDSGHLSDPSAKLSAVSP